MKFIMIGLFLLNTGLFAQSGMIEGIVTDIETGEAMPYANVSIKIDETLKGMVSDEDGYFSFDNVPAGDYDLTVQFLGYKDQISQRIKIKEASSRNLIIEMETDPIMVEEIIIEAPTIDLNIIACGHPICCFSTRCIGQIVESENKNEESAAKQNSDKEETVRLKVYPNPSQGLVQLEIKESLQAVFLSNAQGQRLIELGNLESGKQSIDLSPYPVGMYLVNYVYKEKVFSEKLVLVH